MEDGEGDLGVMLYGYDRGQAQVIKEIFTVLTGRGVMVFGGSGREEDTVQDIIEGVPGAGFGPEKPEVLMFLGFDDGQIGAVLDSFPRQGGFPGQYSAPLLKTT